MVTTGSLKWNRAIEKGFVIHIAFRKCTTSPFNPYLNALKPVYFYLLLFDTKPHMRDPVAESTADETLQPLNDRVKALDGLRIGFYNNAKPAAEPVTDVIQSLFTERYPNATFERFHVPARNEENLRRIGEWAASETDVCLAIIGDCGGCTRAIARATNAIEAAGVSAVGLVAEEFGLSFETNARNEGRRLRYREVPIRSETTDIDLIRDSVTDALLDGIEAALTEPLTDEERGKTEN